MTAICRKTDLTKTSFKHLLWNNNDDDNSNPKRILCYTLWKVPTGLTNLKIFQDLFKSEEKYQGKLTCWLLEKSGEIKIAQESQGKLKIWIFFFKLVQSD